MIEDVLKKVKSPFSDKLIKDLIELFISSKCDNNIFYRTINEFDRNSKIDPEISKLIEDFEKKGVDGSEIFGLDNEASFIYLNDTDWVFIRSEDDPLDENKRTSDKRLPLVYRIYLNIKGKEKIDFVNKYVSICKEKNIPFKFKFSKIDKRDDQIIIHTDEKHFDENLEIVEELSKGLEIGKVPGLIGTYEDRFGISEEYYNRLYSPTTSKVGLIRSSVKKYLCDHIEEFSDILSEEEKKYFDGYIAYYSEMYEFEKEVHGVEQADLRKSFYQKKNDLECYKEHIDTESFTYYDSEGLSKVYEAIIKIYEKDPEKFLTEVTENFKMIGTEVWGFSKDLNFTNSTEEKYLIKKEISKEDIKEVSTENNINNTDLSVAKKVLDKCINKENEKNKE